jgi:hypothetical protein
MQDCAVGQDAHDWNSAMREDREYGHSDPGGSKDLVLAATDLYCSMCDARPCFLLSTAALAVMQEQLTESISENLVGATRYVENLQRLQGCLTRHLENANDAFSLNTYFRVSKEAMSSLREHEAGTGNGKSCNHNGGP